MTYESTIKFCPCGCPLLIEDESGERCMSCGLPPEQFKTIELEDGAYRNQ